MRLLARDVFHRRVRDHGPVTIYGCDKCGSMGTWPVPSDAELTKLYAAFDDGIDPALRRLRGDAPPTAWYEKAVRRATTMAGLSRDAAFTWIDVGAGAGEIGELLNRNFPNATGVSVDWHARPPRLAADARHKWLACDLNAPGFAATIGAKADLVISLSVWEHVRNPDQFVREAVALVKPGGALYLVCPDFASIARQLLRRRWPYWIPGEHLHVPTRTGALMSVKRAMAANGVESGGFVHSISIPYPLAYVMGYAGLERAGKLLRRVPPISLPVGALETGFCASRA